MVHHNPIGICCFHINPNSTSATPIISSIGLTIKHFSYRLYITERKEAEICSQKCLKIFGFGGLTDNNYR